MFRLNSNIDLRQLHYFVAVVDAGSITKASKLYNIAQPALSKRIANLEYEMKVPLLHRGHLGIQPTEQGMILYRAAQRVLRDMDAVIDEVHAVDEDPIGNVSLGCLHSLTALISAPLTIATLQSFPKVRLSAVAGQSADTYRALVDGLRDIALFVHDDEAQNIAIELAIDEQIFITAATHMPGLPDGDVIEPGDLADIPFIFPTAKTFASGPVAMDFLHRLGLEPRIVAEVDGEAIKQLIAGGYGCCVLPWSYVSQEVSAGSIVLKQLRGVSLTRRLVLCSASTRPLTVAAAAVTALLKHVIGEQIASGSWKYARIAQ